MSSIIKKHHPADITEKGCAREESPEINMRSIETTRRVTTEYAAELLGVSESTLRKWRMSGFGPRFFKAGSRVLYDTGELRDWVERRSRTTTAGYPVPTRGSNDDGPSASSDCVAKGAGGGAHG